MEEVLTIRDDHINSGLRQAVSRNYWPVIALADNDTPIICNGFKDADFIEMVMLAQKIGRNIIPVVERYSELAQLVDCASRIGGATKDWYANEISGERKWSMARVGGILQ